MKARRTLLVDDDADAVLIKPCRTADLLSAPRAAARSRTGLQVQVAV